GGGGRLPDEKLVLYASRGGSGGGGRGGGSGGRSFGGHSGGGHYVGAPSGVRRSGGWGVRGGVFGGYRVNGGYRGWYGAGVSYWGGPFWSYRSPWVVLWGPGYYPAPPSHDVLFSALPEGVLPPGASVAGFLYFQRATSPSVRHLDLAWTLHDARTNGDLGSTHVALDVVPR
ncbi:MAG TPA: hypothetical protein VFF06_29800, partial [Polyangia bacterium]|nr:hypothetical protein [Polyangia bacterium]